MIKKIVTYYILLTSILTTTALISAVKIGLQCSAIDQHNYQLQLAVKLSPNELIYTEYIDFSVDDPGITLSEWQPSIEPATYYDTLFKDTKKVFKKSFTITTNAHVTDTLITNAHLRMTYYLRSNQKIQEQIFPLNLCSVAKQTDMVAPSSQESDITPIPTSSQICKQKPAVSWHSYISTLLHKTDSLWLRIILALLLGLLLSLTPCIYPMIPITLGILQSQGTKSLMRNLLLATSYTMGIATTFALLGLTAAFTGQLIGGLLINPIFIFLIVLLFAYLGLSMVGFYEMYIPPFFQSIIPHTQGGSMLSAFLFGAASGTIASPCLSPGLLLLLTIVTTLGNKLLGFILLFAFGIGLSIPLLILGIFSTSFSLLPRAGFWMVEVKKLVGFVQLGLCFYFLGNIFSWSMLILPFSCFILFTALFYLYTARTTPHPWKQVHNIIGTILLTGSLLLFAKSYQSFSSSCAIDPKKQWQTDYVQSLCVAKKENKYLFVYITAPFCSICKAIEKKLFSDPSILDALNNFILVKIDNVDCNNEIHNAVQKKFKVMGVPTYLLIDAATESEINRWGAELYDQSPNLWYKELMSHIHALK